MNKLRNLKNRSNNVLTIGTGGSQSTLANSSSNNSPSAATGTGIFNKLTKRYANAKFLRSQAGRQGAAQPVSSGSYDLTTAELKREIGAPILISKTCIDMDTTDCRVLAHKSLPTSPTTVDCDVGGTQFDYGAAEHEPTTMLHNGGYPLGRPCGSSTVLRKTRSKSASNLHKSELRVFLHRAPSLTMEPNNNYDQQQHHQHPDTAADQTFEVARCFDHGDEQDADDDSDAANSSANINNHSSSNARRRTVALLSSPAAADDNNALVQNHQQRHHQHRKSTSSATSTSSSLSSAAAATYANTNAQHQLRVSSPQSLATTHSSKDSLNREPPPTLHSSREPSFARDSLATTEQRSNSSALSSRQPSPCDDRQRNPFEQATSGEDGLINACDLFRSIEELSAITRQLNEADEFADADAPQHREYCEHRDQLRPDQRRITLLRNKGQSVLNLNVRREKLGNAWTGLKTWIGEEGGRIKEVVHKHAAMQRVGAGPAALSSEADGGVAAAGAAGSGVETAGETDDGGEAATDGPPATAGFLQTLVRKGSKQSSTGSSRGGGADDAEGQNGFEELRRYVKQGGDFGKDLAAILQERVDAEQLYAKSLSKMASKLNKACRDIPGSLADGWRGVAAEMESRSEVHRLFSASMVDEIVKPLRTIIDSQHKTRKAIENAVDKSARVLAEWRTTEAKAKKSSHAAARENEKIQDAMLDVRIQRSPSVAMLHHQVISHNSSGGGGGGGGNTVGTKSPDKEQKLVDKDCAKLDNKRRKAEDCVKRADVEYYTLCIRAERARVEWEMSVLRGSTILQSHENQRLASLKEHLTDYMRFSQLMNPATYQLCERLAPYVTACNVQKDLNVVKNIRRASEGPSEQLLPDFYCEHTTLAMNRERRKHALVKLLQLVRTDLDRERKSRSGLQVIAQSLSTPDNQNVTDKLYHIRSMLTYLEGARFKLQSALLELDHKPRGAHPLAPHIQITRDRTGLQQSILKVPLWLRNGDEADRLSEEYAASDEAAADELSDDIGVEHRQQHHHIMVDGHNDVLIKHFDRNFKRSQSNLEASTAVMTAAVMAASAAATATAATPNGGATTLLVNSANNGGSANNRNARRSTSPTFDRGQADGGSNQPDSDFDEFSSQDEDEELGVKRQSRVSTSVATPAALVISRCRAIYNYEPKLYDELELSPGDLIEVHAKQEDGWWLGALNKKVGIFPATYVEELS